MRDACLSLGLLAMRIAVGVMMIAGHGWGKLAGFAERSAGFPDPLGVGSPVSLGLAVFAEVLCSAAIILGFATRIAAIPLAVTMGVAAFMFHDADPWAKKELAVLYLVVYVALILTGPGRFSVDAVCCGRRRGTQDGDE